MVVVFFSSDLGFWVLALAASSLALIWSDSVLILQVSLGLCQGLYQGLGGDLHLRTLASAFFQEDIGMTSLHRW